VVVRGIGWTGAELPVQVSGGQRLTLDFSLTPQATVLSELVVSATREERRKSETAVSVGIVDAAAMREATPHHPGEIIGRVAGAWVANLGGEGHMTSIRQPITTKPVYTFLEDGVPIRSTGFFNHNGLYEINIPQSDRVEVIKGPGTAVYGSDAVGGVVSVFTRDPSAAPTASLVVEGGRFGYARALVSGSNSWGREGVRADLNVTRSDGYRNDAPYQRQSATLRWDHALGDHARFKTLFSWSHIDQASDGGSDLTRADFVGNLATNYSPITFRRVKAFRVSSAYERRTEASLLTFTAYGRYNSLDIMPSWQLSFDPQVWATSNRSFGLLSRYRRTVPSIQANLSVGADLEYSPGKRMEQGITPAKNGLFYTGFTAGEVQYDYDVAFRQAAPYVQAELSPLDRVHIDLGLRGDIVGYTYDNRLSDLTTGPHRRPASTQVTYRRLSPKVGVAVDLLSTLNVYAAYRAAFRVPSESQLFRQGSATNTVDLKPVRADNYEVGFRSGVGRVASLEASLYRLDIRDDILTFQDPANGLRLATNAGITRHRGIEVAASVAPASGVRLDGSWVHAKHSYGEWVPSTSLDYTGKEIELAPRDLGRIGLTLSPRRLDGATLTAEWIHQGAYWMDPANTTRYEGYSVGNLSARVPLPLGFDLSTRLNNVTNERIAETTSFTPQQGARFRPGAPRTLFVSLRYEVGGR
ncbi:MAG: TonB-dependent receptor, partial [Gemmatimonadales bacterium]|nr:TonB-dependent receptor [Gemmatimonadales bacterium]